MSARPAPEGVCACEPDVEAPCAYCQEMTLWAHEERYGPESLEPDPEYGREGWMRDWDWDDWDPEEE